MFDADRLTENDVEKLLVQCWIEVYTNECRTTHPFAARYPDPDKVADDAVVALRKRLGSRANEAAALREALAEALRERDTALAALEDVRRIARDALSNAENAEARSAWYLKALERCGKSKGTGR